MGYVQSLKPGVTETSRGFDKYERFGAYHWDMGNSDRLYMEHVAYIQSVFASAKRVYSETTILDVGCGDGYIAGKLAELGLTVHAIDMNSEAIRLAEDKCASLEVTGQIEFESEDFFRLRKAPPFILASDVLEHLYKPEQFVDKLVNLSPTVALISTPLKRRDGRLWDPDYHVTEFSEEELKELFACMIDDYGITYAVHPKEAEYRTQYILLEKRTRALKSLLNEMELYTASIRMGASRRSKFAFEMLGDGEVDEVCGRISELFALRIIED